MKNINMEKLEDILSVLNLNDIVNKKKEEEKKKDKWKIVLVVIIAAAVVGALVFAVYKFLTPDYLEDFDDDFDDDFDEDFFDDEDIMVDETKKEK